MARRKFEVGLNYYNPHKAPGTAPEGYEWKIVDRHPEKNYATGWTLVSTATFQKEVKDFPTFAGRSSEGYDHAVELTEQEARKRVEG